MAEEKKQHEKEEDFVPKLSRSTMILRRNLMAVSTLTLMALVFDLEINASNILGISIDGLTKNEIYAAALIFLGYFTLHFTWNAVIEWRELRIKSVVLFSEVTSDETEIKLTPFKTIRRAIYDLQDEANYFPLEDHPPGYEEIRTSISGEELNNLWRMLKYAAIRFYGLEIGLPLFMAICAMGWLAWSIIVATFFPH